MAEERDPALDVAQQLLLVPDLVHYWLCGARATEFTNATTTQCLDAAERTWAVDLLERLDVPARTSRPSSSGRGRSSARSPPTSPTRRGCATSA